MFASGIKQSNNDNPILKRKVTFYFNNDSIGLIINKIAEKESINFSYINQKIPLSRQVSASVENEPLEKLLKKVFANTHIKIYQMHDHIILVKKNVIDSVVKKVNHYNNINESSKQDSVTQFHLYGEQDYQVFSRRISFYDFLKAIVFPQEARYKKITSDTLVINRAVKLKKDSTILKKDTILNRKFRKRTFKEKLHTEVPGWFLNITVNSAWNKPVLRSNDPVVKNPRSWDQFLLLNPAFSSSFKLVKNFNDFFFISSGVGFNYIDTKRKHLEKKHNEVYDIRHENEVKLHQRLGFLELPLKVSWIQLIGDFPIKFSGSFISQYRIYKKEKKDNFQVYRVQYFQNIYKDRKKNYDNSPYYDKKGDDIQKKDKQYKAFNFSFRFNINTSIFIGKNTLIHFGPYTEYFFMNIYKNNPMVKENPFLLGINIQMDLLNFLNNKPSNIR